MHRYAPAVGLCLAVGLAGCATSAIDMAPQRADRPWAPATSADGEILAGEHAAAPSTEGFVLPANPSLARLPSEPTVDGAKTYGLADLIDLAESANPETRMAWDDARRSALAAGIAASAYLPRVTATAVGGFQGSNGHDAAMGVNVLGDGSASGVISAVSVQWLLFDFGERGAVVDAAKQGSVISNIAFTATHQQVIYDVALAYYADVAAQARLGAATQALENAKAVQAAAEDRYAHGVGTVMEASQARQATAQSQLAQVQASGAAQDAYLALMTAIGISPLTKIKLADISGRPLVLSMEAPVERLVADALGRRTDVQSAYAAQKASQAEVRAAQAEFMPKVFASATGAYNSGGLGVTALPSIGSQAPTVNINNSRFSGGVFAGITIPLYDGGIRAAVVAQSKAEADGAAARLDRVRDQAIRQIVQADNSLHTSLAAYAAAQSVTVAAQTTFDSALAAYRNGVGSITELTLAQTRLLEANTVASDAYYSALSAAATLALATGGLGSAPL